MPPPPTHRGRTSPLLYTQSGLVASQLEPLLPLEPPTADTMIEMIICGLCAQMTAGKAYGRVEDRPVRRSTTWAQGLWEERCDLGEARGLYFLSRKAGDGSLER